MTAKEDPHNILVPLKKYDEIPSVPSDKLDSIRYVGSGTGIGGPFIVVTASYTGGDNEHSFLACWNGAWLKSNPPGMSIVLLHDAHGDKAKAIISKTLQISLSAAAGGMATYAIVHALGNDSIRGDIEL
jgi:hypothetical protein